MPKEEKQIRPPRRGPHGPGVPGEKAKDFKVAVKRLLKELHEYQGFIIFSLALAALGAILSILAPNQLSKLTDTIAEGLVINQENMKEITTKIAEETKQDQLSTKVQRILKFNITEETLNRIMIDPVISKEDKMKFQQEIRKISQMESPMQMVPVLLQMPDAILTILLPDSVNQGVLISTEDKIQLLKQLASMKEEKKLTLPDSISQVFFDEIIIDGVTITSKEQYQFLKEMSQLGKETTPSEIYQTLDKMPESIQEVVKPKMNTSKIKKITLFLVCLYLCSALFTYIQARCMTRVSNYFARGLRSKISNKINLLPLKYFDRNTIGDILSRVTNDVDMIAQNMNHSLASFVSSITLFLGTIIMMFYTDWILALTAIFSSLLGFMGMSLILKKSQKYFVAKQTELGNLNGHIEEIYSGHNVVKAYNGMKEATEQFDKFNQKVSECNRKSQFLSGLMQPMMGFIGNFGYVAVCIVGAILTMNDTISFGVIVAFITYVRLFTQPLSQIAQAMTSLQSTAASSERVFEFIDEEEMSDQKEITTYLEKDKVKGNIEFQKVEFQYDGNDHPTIKDFTAKAKKGQKIAIVGPTGAGKTTMVNLLMKFYEIQKGDIKIDGISTKEISRENLHELFTMVLQDTWLFSGTIKENIIYNRKDVSDEQVKKVCKEIGLDHFIKTLPKGYDTDISENDSISAGQRQLLTIARGMIEDSPFLILDEATSNVDTRTEELVQKAMDKLTEGKTSFIIAHRLSTIKNADLILVMNEGNIIEQGTHEELMKQKGFYENLYNSQFEL